MPPYQELFKIGNATVIKDDKGKLGISDSSNSIVEAVKYDSIQPLANDPSQTFLKVVENGLIGIYNAKKVEFVKHCTLSRIDKIEKGTVYGKEPFKLFGITLFHIL